MAESLPDLPRYVRKRGDEWEGAPCKYGPWRPIPAPAVLATVEAWLRGRPAGEVK